MSKVFSGARGSVKINSQKVAYVGNVTINHENTLTPVDVLDQLEVAEHAETAHIVSATVNLFKIDENAAAVIENMDPKNIDDLLYQPELTFEIYDRVSKIVRYTMSGVKFSGGSGSLDARGIWNGTWNFVGRLGHGL